MSSATGYEFNEAGVLVGVVEIDTAQERCGSTYTFYGERCMLIESPYPPYDTCDRTDAGVVGHVGSDDAAD